MLPARLNYADLDALYREYRAAGVVVVEGVFDPDECDRLMDSLVGSLEELTPGLDRADPTTWKADRCLPQTRRGLYQTGVGNLPAPWAVRTDPRIWRVFAVAHGVDPVAADYISSGDGVNVKPGVAGPYTPVDAATGLPAEIAPEKKGGDWAHLDQTRGARFRCTQGQVVLTNTSAAFRASPGSHLAFEGVLATTGGTETGDWRKFTPEQIPAVRGLVEAAGGSWQIPIRASKGSVILWASSVIHSAMYQAGPEPPTTADRWYGWRGVIYVCLRPRVEFTAAELKRRRGAYEKNRVTNHWATRIFPVSSRYGPVSSRFCLADGTNYISQPEAGYEVVPRPKLATGRERRLVGYDDARSPFPEAALPPNEDSPLPAIEKYVATDADLLEALGF